MMSDSAALLRMLEPAVRPVTTPAASGSGARASQLPLEQRDFESLLNELQTMQQTEQTDAAAEQSRTRLNPLRSLGQLGAIENASMRGLISGNPAGGNPVSE
ncbi:MAG: hypothetical protein IT445_12455 [Phycisphaeraceae bacterium]|nr:hypothetical protein [Phycisphaeraceae bacterium]